MHTITQIPHGEDTSVHLGLGRLPHIRACRPAAVMGIMFSSSNFLGMINLMSVMPVVGYERVVSRVR